MALLARGLGLWVLTDQILGGSREIVLRCEMVEKWLNVPAKRVDRGRRDEAVRLLLSTCLDAGAVPQFPSVAFDCSSIDLGADGLDGAVASEP